MSPGVLHLQYMLGHFEGFLRQRCQLVGKDSCGLELNLTFLSLNIFLAHIAVKRGGKSLLKQNKICL